MGLDSEKLVSEASFEGLAEARAALAPRAGLCARCAFLRPLSNSRSVFVFCLRSRQEAGFARYPPLPVLSCRGFEASEG